MVKKSKLFPVSKHGFVTHARFFMSTPPMRKVDDGGEKWGGIMVFIVATKFWFNRYLIEDDFVCYMVYV